LHTTQQRLEADRFQQKNRQVILQEEKLSSPLRSQALSLLFRLRGELKKWRHRAIHRQRIAKPEGGSVDASMYLRSGE